ncbi:MAG: PAS domain S-box protein [Thermodesulfobacteriota bacterium]
MPTRRPITAHTTAALWMRRIVAALFLVAIVALQIINILLTDALGNIHKTQMDHLSNIRNNATAAHLSLEKILAGAPNGSFADIEAQLRAAIEQTRRLPISCQVDTLAHHDNAPADFEQPLLEIVSLLETMITLSRQRLAAPTADGPSLTLRYDNTFSQLIDAGNRLDTLLWRSRDQDKSFLKRIQLTMIGGSVFLALLTILVFHRYDMARIHAMETLSEKKEREQFISQFSRFCRDSVAMEPVYEMVTSWLAEHLLVERASVWLFQDGGEYLSCSCLYQRVVQRFSQGQIVSSKDFPEYIEQIKGDTALVVEDALSYPPLGKFTEQYLRPLDIRSILNFPIKQAGHTVGLLILATQGTRKAWSEEEVNLCSTIADQISNAYSRIEERELREKAQAEHASHLEEEVRNRTSELETANRTLRENEARLQLTFDKAPFGAALVDLEGQIITANEELCRMLGYSEAELRSRPFADLLQPESRDACSGQLQQILAGSHEISGADKNYLRKDGELALGRTTIRLVRDENGAPLYFLPTVEDVSERKLYEEQLKRLFKAIEQSPLSIVITDPAGHIEYANPFFSTVTGYSLAEVVGKKPSALKSGVHDTAFYESMWQTIASGKTWQGEICNRKKDGSLFWEYVTIAPVSNNDGKVESYIAVKEDISERKQLADALRERSEILASIASAALSAIVMMDSEGRITFWNSAAERIFGWNREEAIGKDLHLLLAPSSYQKSFRENFATFHQTGGGPIVGTQVELTGLRRDGTELPVELSISALRINGQWHAVGLIHDISDRKEAEAAILAARDEAQEANRAKSDFLARMSHEIRTPMNAIIGLSHLALERDLSPTVRDYLTKIANAGRNLLHIINDILDFSKIETQKLTIEPHPFSLEKVLNDLAGLTSIKAQEKEVELLFDVAADVPDRLEGDSLRLGQVLLNLVSNAIKFTEQGEVVVALERVDGRQDRPRLRFSVRDTGPGLSEEQLAKLFTPFSQADGSISRTHGGTGLGLAISKRLVELMGGELGAESTPGRGSTFSFTLPLVESTGTPSPGPSGLPGLRILVVEDNPATRAILSRALESFACEVAAVASGEECLATIERHGAETPFDLILLDYRLPGLSGEAVARAVRERTEGRGLPRILMLTGTRIEEVISQCLAAGCDRVVSKPVSRTGLLAAILATLNPSQASEPAIPQPRSTTSRLRFDGARILLVEDNQINQQVACEILEQMGIRVETADNGEEALTLVQNNQYDLVLMDIQMPRLDGLEATRRIRASGEERLHRLPIVAMTAHAIKGDEELSLAAGMNDHITKPIDPAILAATLGKWLPKDSSPPAAAQPASSPEVPAGLPREIAGIDVALGLERLGNAELYRKVLLAFAENYHSTAGSVATMLQAGEWEEAQRTLHTLKGVVGTLCAQTLYASTVALEKACLERQVPSELLTAFQHDHATLVESLRNALGMPSPDLPAAELPVEPERLRQLLMALLPDLEAHRPVQCAQHGDRLQSESWPAALHLEKENLLNAIGNYRFRLALEIARTLIDSLEHGDS